MPLREYAGRAWGFVRTLRREFAKDNGGMVAAAMSFYALVSIPPLLLVAVAVLGFVLRSSEQAYVTVLEYVGRFYPAAALDVLGHVVRTGGAVGGLGLIFLLWSGSSVFLSLEKAVNIAWAVKVRRGFLRERALAIGMTLGAGVLLLASVGLTTLAGMIRKAPGLRVILSEMPQGWHLAGLTLPLILTIGMFTLVYKLLPNRPVRLRHALAGGLVAGILCEIGKHAFGWYVSSPARYSVIYGSLTAAIVLMIWIYYSSVATIIGAEVAAINAGVGASE